MIKLRPIQLYKNLLSIAERTYSLSEIKFFFTYNALLKDMPPAND